MFTYKFVWLIRPSMKIILILDIFCIFRYTSNGSTFVYYLLPVTEELFASKSYSVVTGMH